MVTVEDVLHFWFDELEPSQRFNGGEEVDNLIRDRFLNSYEDATNGKLDQWKDTPNGSLALILILDQFSRNMFRGDGRSFELDSVAIKLAGEAIEKDFDLQHGVARRGFFYLPFMHSEDLNDQNKCIELISSRLGDDGKNNLIHAKAHKHIIEKFGRFPYRNEALKRQNTPEESSWLENVGYGEVVGMIEGAEKERS